MNMLIATAPFVAVLLLATANSVSASSLHQHSPQARVTQLDSCIVAITGDVNGSGAVTSGDIIYLVNTVFLSGPEPVPCRGVGDVDCNGLVSSADIIYLVNYMFKSGIAPIDNCACEWAVTYGCIL
jgi:hypothetical protein